MYISERNYGDSFDTKADVVILCPHGSMGSKFIQEHGICDLVTDVNVFAKFNELEADKGSFELARSIADEISVRRNDLLVRVIEVGIPRSVIDCNRVESNAAVRRIVNWAEFHKVHSELVAIHRDTIEQLKELALANRRPGSVLLDLHTMADFSPVCAVVDPSQPALAEEQLGLESYVSSYLDAVNNGRPRHTNLITSLDESCIADRDFTTACEIELQAAGFAVSHDVPYSLSRRLMSFFYAANSRSITIDFKKGDLHFSDNLIGEKVDPKRVGRLAVPISRAIVSQIR